MGRAKRCEPQKSAIVSMHSGELASPKRQGVVIFPDFRDLIARTFALAFFSLAA